MNMQRFTIFENDLPIDEQLKQSFLEINKKPRRFIKIFWFLMIQIFIAVFGLVSSFYLPFVLF